MGTTTILRISGALVLGSGLLGGCGLLIGFEDHTVNDAPAGGGEGGFGGTSTSGGGDLGGAGGASGATVCDQGCGHAEEDCDVPACKLVAIDCTAGYQYDCIAQCILDADCKQIDTMINLQSDPTKVDPKLLGCLYDCCGPATCPDTAGDCTLPACMSNGCAE